MVSWVDGVNLKEGEILQKSYAKRFAHTRNYVILFFNLLKYRSSYNIYNKITLKSNCLVEGFPFKKICYLPWQKKTEVIAMEFIAW
jgi:hypothetical protein